MMNTQMQMGMMEKRESVSQKACTPESGTCQTCQSYCRRKPGWFLPGEAEKAAELLGLSLPEFFRRHLAIDWWTGDPPIFVLSPAIRGEAAGEEFPGDPLGTCVFFQEGRCQIHTAKPAECRDAWCGGGKTGIHHDIAVAWDTPENQAQIRELLGREPEAADWDGDGLDVLSWLSL